MAARRHINHHDRLWKIQRKQRCEERGEEVIQLNNTRNFWPYLRPSLSTTPFLQPSCYTDWWFRMNNNFEHCFEWRRQCKRNDNGPIIIIAIAKTTTGQNNNNQVDNIESQCWVVSAIVVEGKRNAEKEKARINKAVSRSFICDSPLLAPVRLMDITIRGSVLGDGEVVCSSPERGCPLHKLQT